MENKIDVESTIIDVWNKIQIYQNIVIISHTNPDGDSLGSQIGLFSYCKEIGKNVKAYISDKPSYIYSFLEGSDQLKIYDNSEDLIDIINADLVFVLDLNDLSRMKALGEAVLKSKAFKIVVDHNIDPKPFADLYLVDSDASSTGELVWKIIECDKNYSINKTSAIALYTAIMTDTGGFRFPKTDREVHQIAGKLIEAGANPAFIYDAVYNQISINAIKLLGLAYFGIESYYDGQLLIMTITDEMFRKTNTKEEDIENFAEKFLQIKGSKIAVLITEILKRAELRVSFRAKAGYNVRDIAVKLGGGGHIEAAGARVYSKNIEKLKKQIIEEFSHIFGTLEIR